MELRTYLEILWRRKWAILSVTVITVLVTMMGTFRLPPIYRASATLRVATASSGALGEGNYNLPYADRLMNTYSKIATSSPVQTELMQRLGVVTLPTITVSIVPNTELIRITAEGEAPSLVSDAANTLANILSAQSSAEYTRGAKTARELLSEQLDQALEELNQARRQYESLLVESPEDNQQLQALSRSIELKERTYATILERYEEARTAEALQANAVSLVEPAVAPQNPSGPSKIMPIALALLVGLVGGVGLAFLYEHLDTTLYTAKQVATVTQLSPIGLIPADRRRRKSAIFNSNSAQEEAFRRLRTYLLTVDEGRHTQMLLVTSAEPGEGKSTVVANLAVSLAKSGRKVLAVDGDLRLPVLHKIFNLPNELGLSNVLEQDVPVNKVMQHTHIPGLTVLPSGPLPPNPAELLGSSGMTAVMKQLAQQFDVVLFDSPALLAVTDAAVLAPTVDGVILVVRRAHTRQETVQAAQQQLTDVKARTVGIVVNRAEQNGSHHYAFIRQKPVEHHA